MCNQKDCQHESKKIIISDRDLMIGRAFMATMFMQIIKGTRTNHDSADWMVHAGACAIDCTNPDCRTSRAMQDSLAQAIDHVDNGADLDIVDVYNKGGLLNDGKALTTADRLAQLLKSSGNDLGQLDGDSDEAVIDTIVVDTAPAFIDVSGDSDSAPVEIGRMVGSDRGRATASKQLH